MNKKKIFSLVLVIAMIFNFIIPFKVKAQPELEKAWFLWNNNGNIAKHYFDNLEGGEDINGHMVFNINMIEASDVTDEDDNTIVPNISALTVNSENYQWVTGDGYQEIVTAGITTWSDFLEYKQNVIKHAQQIDDRDYEWERLFDPMGAKNAVNSISTNANRRFRATIFDADKYEAIQFGTTKDDYTYFPWTWDPTFFDSTVDISGSTADKPAVYSSYILEKNLKFTIGDNSQANIKSVTPLNVNAGAVTVSITGDLVSIKFNSNYYDEVLFKIVDVDGNEYYLKVNRFSGSTFSNYMDIEAGHANKLKIGMNVYFDDANTHDDYEVKANVKYSDGSTKIIDAKYVNNSEDDFGKKIKVASYEIEVTYDMVSVDFTIVKKNALTGNSYGGTFAGSGKGYHFEDEILKDQIKKVKEMLA